MKKVYANYCVLVSFEVSDETTEEEIDEMIAEEYGKRGYNLDDFDDGEVDIVEK